MKPLHVRLLAWGTVLVVAAIAFNVRAGAEPEVDNGANGPQLNGGTSQGTPIWAVLDEDGKRVREIRMVWEVRCDKGVRIDAFGLTARDTVRGFRTHGDWFAFSDTRRFDEGDGWMSTVRSRITGDAASGTASVEIRFEQGELDDFTCRSGPVRWSLSR